MNKTTASNIHVMIDVSSVPYGRGVSRYTSNVVQSLVEQPGLALHLLGYSLRQQATLRAWMNQFGSTVDSTLLPLPPSGLHRLWQSVGMPQPQWIAPGLDVYHAWDWQLAPVGSVPQVVTIHDLAYRLYPETAHPKVVAMYDRLLATLERHPEIQIIAVSESTKKDIVNLTAIPPEQVTVIYEALPREAQYVPSEQEVTAVKKNLPGTKPFLLTVGTTEPRKNLRRVIAAWEKIRDQFDLYIVGAEGWDELPQSEGIHYMGYVDSARLASLYRLAHALVYVSLYEGFGLPILEAYFHGCPVVTSQVSSMVEIAGPGAELVDPYNVAAIAEACQSIEASDSLARKKRVAKMQQTLDTFSWDQAAAETKQVYQLVKERS
ncbi:glycosyltransferase family 4 protein [Candidatus Woesebacteria bacterium]|nr:glycosyltransferase family 4 protein [Candidatus Woesebacteria bacterium]MCD8506921.1 glycosyltransferase family 4 protein [Candidatus Woesebacteria bacterium]MCD8546202.1 glycosyltransferase family 4 protein [Candidatus Woesebacteria bacterium]